MKPWTEADLAAVLQRGDVRQCRNALSRSSIAP